MKVCKRKLDTNRCMSCIETQMEFNVTYECSRCNNFKNREYEILDFEHTIFGTYAILLYDGKVAGVPIGEIYDVREKD